MQDHQPISLTSPFPLGQARSDSFGDYEHECDQRSHDESQSRGSSSVDPPTSAKRYAVPHDLLKPVITIKNRVSGKFQYFKGQIQSIE
jgi:hypothetical protein